MATQKKLVVDAKVTSKGQITIPNAVRKELGLVAGARVRFEGDRRNMRVVAARPYESFTKFIGMGNPGIPKGMSAAQFMRELKGNDDLD